MKVFKWTALAVAISSTFPVLAQTPAEQEKAQEQQQKEQQPQITQQQSEAATDDSDIEIVEVKGVKQADLKARDLERMKNGFSSVISTDDLGNFVDQNVAESLRRLPGVTLQRSEGEGKFVTVRGLGPGFVSVNMNGSQMSGAGEEWPKRYSERIHLYPGQ